MSKEKSDINWDLMAKHLAGETDGTEEAVLAEWMNKSETNRRHFAALEHWWSLTQYGEVDTESDWLKVKQHLNLYEPVPVRRKRMMPPVPRRNVFERYSFSKSWAAVFVVLLLLGGVYHVFTGSNKQPAQPAEMAYHQILVPSGQRSQILLADGSAVWLNSGSRLLFPESFEKDSRTVKLEGEAYFEVTADKKKPFVVQTSGLEVKVYGTSFNVTSYPNEGTEEVTLLTGSVKVAGLDSNHAMVLQPGQKMVYRRNGHLFTGPLNADVETETAWRDGKIVFDDMSIGEIARKLERRYGVTIRIENKNIENLRYRGVFRKESLEQALKAIQLTAQYKYTIKEDVVTIY